MATPPPVPSTPSTSPSSSSCKWCNKPMATGAIRCESCGKLRKDIYEDKMKCYTFCILGGLGIGIAFALHPDNSAKLPMLIIGIIAALVGIYFYVIASQKLKTFWWS